VKYLFILLTLANLLVGCTSTPTQFKMSELEWSRLHGGYVSTKTNQPILNGIIVDEGEDYTSYTTLVGGKEVASKAVSKDGDLLYQSETDGGNNYHGRYFDKLHSKHTYIHYYHGIYHGRFHKEGKSVDHRNYFLGVKHNDDFLFGQDRRYDRQFEFSLKLPVAHRYANVPPENYSGVIDYREKKKRYWDEYEAGKLVARYRFDLKILEKYTRFYDGDEERKELEVLFSYGKFSTFNKYDIYGRKHGLSFYKMYMSNSYFFNYSHGIPHGEWLTYSLSKKGVNEVSKAVMDEGLLTGPFQLGSFFKNGVFSKSVTKPDDVEPISGLVESPKSIKKVINGALQKEFFFSQYGALNKRVDYLADKRISYEFKNHLVQSIAHENLKGQRHGPYIYYKDSRHDTVTKGEYFNGSPVGTFSTYINDWLGTEEEYVTPSLKKIRTFHRNGTINEEGEMKLLGDEWIGHGTFRRYNKSGELTLEACFDDKGKARRK